MQQLTADHQHTIRDPDPLTNATSFFSIAFMGSVTASAQGWQGWRCAHQQSCSTASRPIRIAVGLMSLCPGKHTSAQMSSIFKWSPTALPLLPQSWLMALLPAQQMVRSVPKMVGFLFDRQWCCTGCKVLQDPLGRSDYISINDFEKVIYCSTLGA